MRLPIFLPSIFLLQLHTARNNSSPPDYPARPKFERLTRQEEKTGLLNGDFGFWKRNDWQAILRTHNLRQRGHQLVRRKL